MSSYRSKIPSGSLSSLFIKPDFPPDLTKEEIISNALQKLQTTGKVGKTPNAFMAYRMSLKKQIAKTGYRPTMGEVSTIAGTLWEEEPDDVKAAYQMLTYEAKIYYEQIWRSYNPFQIVQVQPNNVVNVESQSLADNVRGYHFTPTTYYSVNEFNSWGEQPTIITDSQGSDASKNLFQNNLPLNNSEAEPAIDNNNFCGRVLKKPAYDSETIDLGFPTLQDQSEFSFSQLHTMMGESDTTTSLPWCEEGATFPWFSDISPIMTPKEENNFVNRVAILECLIESLLHDRKLIMPKPFPENLLEKVSLLEQLTSTLLSQP
ncbi:hypothetical protein G9A89_001010 [Geosiphon pyriformis]|nr:hypothetical protein G9A89_001010 [Geosiphon pyriformis]